MLPRFITEGLERAVLLRRHVAADHRRRGDGYRAAGRVAAHHAALRWFHEEDPDSRPAGTLSAAVLRRAAGAERRDARPARARARGRRPSGWRGQHRLPKISTGDILRPAVQNGHGARRRGQAGDRLGQPRRRRCGDLRSCGSGWSCADARRRVRARRLPADGRPGGRASTRWSTRAARWSCSTSSCPEDVLVQRLASRRICCRLRRERDCRFAGGCCLKCGGSIWSRGPTMGPRSCGSV